MTWETSTLGELMRLEGGLIQTGPFGSQLKQAEYTESGVPVIMPKDIRNGTVDPVTVARISEEKSGKLARHRVKPDSIVFPRRGEITKRAYVTEDQNNWICGTGCLKIEPQGKSVHPRFLYYFMGTSDSVDWLLKNAVGSTMLNLSAEILSRFPVKLPSIDTQKKIASVLSAYDDLIENNRRRIALLEEAARLLYREWFVHFRFPGHEHVKIIDGVPEGWCRIKLGDLTTKLGSGATPRGGAGAYEASGITLIRSLNIYDHSFHDDGLVFINDDQAKKLSNVTLQSKDVLINITGASVGRCCIVPERHLPARVNQHVMIVRVDRSKCSPLFVLHSINSHQNKEKLLSIARAGGATREALTKDTIAGFEILVPTQTLVEAFDELTLPMFEQTEILASSISQLTKARDLLLPRLMDGRLEV